jgi:aspartyl-tRNA(Asn)/glutamyl-tRNA(Gln) amidotransferase subunit C
MAEAVISKKLVVELAQYTRLGLNEAEVEKYTQQLNVIIDAFKKLDEVSTEDVKPSYHPLEITDNLRQDKAEKWIWDPLKNVESKEKRYIRGPKIK